MPYHPVFSCSTPRRIFQKCFSIQTFVLLVLLPFTSIPVVVKAQTYLEKFGQNRIQNRAFPWKVFETEHFRIYHYDRSGKDLARYVAEQAELDWKQNAHKINAGLDDKFNIILYNTYEDYVQSNIGRSFEATTIRATQSGTLDFAEDKLAIYFTGVHEDLRQQMRKGMANILLSKSIKEDRTLTRQLRNSVTVDIPEWIQKGYVRYTSDGWDEKTDKAWHSIIASKPEKKFYYFKDVDESLTGAAFWKYIKEKHGDTAIKPLLAAMKAKGNMNKALISRFGMNVVRTFDSCLAFYKNAYDQDAKNKETRDPSDATVRIQIPRKNSAIIRDVKVSPRGADVAFVRWQQGVFQVCLKHTIGEQQESVILEGGERNYNQPDDPNYPLLAWSNTGYKLAILYKKGNGLRLRLYDATKGKAYTYVVPNNRFDRALGMAIDEDNNGIILSAIRKSQTDLYYFAVKGAKMRNLTDDLWDDVAPAFVTGGQKRGVMFLSNRPKANLKVPLGVNELPVGPMNVFFYNTTTKSPKLFRCSNVDSFTNVSQPIQYGPDNFAYLADTKGTKNQYVVVFGRDKNNRDSAYWVPSTNLAHSIKSHQYNPAGNLVAEVIEQAGNYNVFIRPFVVPEKDYKGADVQKATLVESESEKIGLIGKLEPHQKNNKKNKGAINMPMSNVHFERGGAFLSDFAQSDNDGSKKGLDEATTQASLSLDAIEASNDSLPGQDSTFIKMKPQKYRVGFKPSSLSMSLDNNILFNRYQAAGFSGNRFANPPLGGLATIHLNDLMEDYRFTAAFRLPFAASTGSTYFVQFENVRRRVDWNVAFLRDARSQRYELLFVDTFGNPLFSTLAIGKTTTAMLQSTASYPFDNMRSLRLQLGLRQDMLNFKAIDTFTLITPNQRRYWTMSRLEFVYDNTKFITTNIFNGTRYKVFAEYMAQMNDQGGAVYNFGFDFRNYQKIYKNLIWAFRAAAAHSGGKQKILYYLGGVDNWLNHSQAVPAAPINQESYGFQALGNNLRGYRQNARNGNSYAVANTELRFPILSDLVRRPIQSKVLRSLQVITFADFGVAWNGLFPNNQTMAKSQYYNSFPVGVSVNVPATEGTALGYGAGIRCAISGYQIRLDAAWNKEGIRTPIMYLSFGTDF